MKKQPRSDLDEISLATSLFLLFQALDCPGGHSIPFSKSRRGNARRDERSFVIKQKQKLINPRN